MQRFLTQIRGFLCWCAVVGCLSVPLAGCLGRLTPPGMGDLGGEAFNDEDATWGTQYRRRDDSIQPFAATKKGRQIERSLGGN